MWRDTAVAANLFGTRIPSFAIPHDALVVSLSLIYLESSACWGGQVKLELTQSRTLSEVEPGEDTRAEDRLEQPVPLTRRQYPLGCDSSEGSAGACS